MVVLRPVESVTNDLGFFLLDALDQDNAVLAINPLNLAFGVGANKVVP